MKNKESESPKKRMKKDFIVGHLSMDVIATILAMLPAKTLLKFKCVCMSWNYLIEQDPYFAAQHLSSSKKKKSTSVTLSCSRRWDYDYYAQDYALIYCPCYSWKVHMIDFSTVRDEYRMTNSCNGLVGVYAQDRFCVANPSIMKLATLPRGSPHIRALPNQMPLAGIGFEPSTALYKAVRVFTRKYERYRPVSVGCEVFYLGGSCWKSVEDPPVLLRYMEESDLCSVVEETMYWTVQFEVIRPGLLRPEIALSFDLKEEKFSVVLHPEGSLRPKVSCIIAIRGQLCIVDTLMHLEQMKIWTLKDRRSSEWVEQYTIDLSIMHRRIGVSIGSVMSFVKPLTIDGQRIVLLPYRGERVYYDLMTMRKVKRKRNDYVSPVYIGPYTESIVWPFCC